MIPGLGLVRRTITLALCAASFWGGMKIGQAGQADACQTAGGAWDQRGFCSGPKP